MVYGRLICKNTVNTRCLYTTALPELYTQNNSTRRKRDDDDDDGAEDYRFLLLISFMLPRNGRGNAPRREASYDVFQMYRYYIYYRHTDASPPVRHIDDRRAANVASPLTSAGF